jgi:hypothetical protein
MPIAFFSYSREDSEFALRLANDLRAAGSDVWIDQLDIGPGERWDRVVQSALESCPSVLVILSPASVNSNNVLDEVSFALDQQKTLIPVLYRDCDIPFRLRRFQHLDFRGDYERMLQELRKCLHVGHPAAATTPENARPQTPLQNSTSPSHPVHKVERAAAPPAATPVRSSPVPAQFRSDESTPPSSIPAWAKYGIPAAIVVIAVIVYLLAGSSASKRSEQENRSRVQQSSPSEPLQGTAAAADITGTAIAHAQTSPPCSLPATSDSEFSTSDPSVYFFFAFRHGNPSDQWTVDWIEPNRRVHKTITVEHAAAAGHYCFEMKIAGGPAAKVPGEWMVRLNRNGSDVAERKFTITR